MLTDRACYNLREALAPSILGQGAQREPSVASSHDLLLNYSYTRLAQGLRNRRARYRSLPDLALGVVSSLHHVVYPDSPFAGTRRFHVLGVAVLHYALNLGLTSATVILSFALQDTQYPFAPHEPGNPGLLVLVDWRTGASHSLH